MIFLNGNSILAKEYAAGILVNKTPITIIEHEWKPINFNERLWKSMKL